MSDGFLLGIDIGSSSVKASLLDIATGAVTGSATSPSTELPINAVQHGWAEQDPDLWWEHIVKAVRALQKSGDCSAVRAIGISYQMHGLVVVDKNNRPLRPSIIWCDSRAVTIGEHAFDHLGADRVLPRLLNSPGNFTASKLRWVKENEPAVFAAANAFMLPGDYAALRMTGKRTTTLPGLSEGMLWDFIDNTPSTMLLEEYEIDPALLPPLCDTFGFQGELTAQAAEQLGLAKAIPVTYRAGDQPNNALSLNVLAPGEIAATAGTSGVVYGVLAKPAFDPQSRVNSFAHVNYTRATPNCGVLLCVNGSGILNSWMRTVLSCAAPLSYTAMDALAAAAPCGSDGLMVFPYGNGAERTLQNRSPGASIQGLQLTRHTPGHLLRASQEGIVFALNYGFEIMREMGMQTRTIRAGKANMFLSPLFRETFAAVTGTTIELYNTDGAAGAARGAGIGAGIYQFDTAFDGLETILTIEPQTDLRDKCQVAYDNWKNALEKNIRS